MNNGAAETLAPVDADKLFTGDHAKLLAVPVAVKVALPEPQMAPLVAAETEGNEIEVTTLFIVATGDPQISDTVTE